MSFFWRRLTRYRFMLDTKNIAQATLLFALTYTSSLPWWKWGLFILSYIGFDARYQKEIESSNKHKSIHSAEDQEETER